MQNSPAGRVGPNLIALLVLAVWQPDCIAARQPFRLDTALAPAPWFDLSGDYRVRYESLSGQFRSSLNGSDQVLVHRTRLRAEAGAGNWSVVGELQDSRGLLNDSGSSVTTTVVNAVELLLGHIAYAGTVVLRPGDSLSARGGRLTMDVGSRRFVARNRFRNTANAFTGVDLEWRAQAGSVLRAFWTLPIQRLPLDLASRIDDEVEFDREDIEVMFSGLHLTMDGRSLPTWPDSLGWVGQPTSAEVYVFRLDEEDAPGRNTRDRRLTTVGMRLLKGPNSGELDYQLEAVGQFGRSRRSSAVGDPELDHLAGFVHAALGYTFHAAWSPRLLAQFDYASGDDDPDDGDNNRFDTLFGARRFEFGPTGIYGPFARSNLVTPGWRMQLRPTKRLRGFFAHRGYWLASDQDALTTASVQDPTGNSGSFLGQQVEARVRFDLVPGNVRLETGAAYLFSGAFLDEAPNRSGEGDSAYGYGQLSIQF